MLCCLDFARKLFEICDLASARHAPSAFTRMFAGFPQNEVSGGDQPKSALVTRESALPDAGKIACRHYFSGRFPQAATLVAFQ